MLRLIVVALIIVFIITLVRAFAGVLRQALLNAAAADKRGRAAPKAAAQGELRRDPVCGTFVAADTAVRKTLKGETVYFCSTECRDRYQPAG
jgi:YHS domain-containing protein